MTPKRPEHSHILVTGAGTGIGRAIALRLATEGVRLSLLGRTEETLRATADQISDMGGSQATIHLADIRDRGAVDRAINEAAERQGPLRGIIANSGIGGPNQPGPEDRFDDLIQTNLIGTYSCLRAAQRHLHEEGTTYMVVIASILARFGVPGYTGYCASKTALLGLVRALSMELAAQDVQVNAICPGWVDTKMAWEGIEGMATGMSITREEAYQMAMRAVPMGRMSKPEDIAGMVSWLTGSDARGVTGQSLDMNGGAWM